MQDNKFLTGHSVGEGNFQTVALRETASNQASPTESPRNVVTAYHGQLLVTACLVVIALALTFSRNLNFCQTIDKKVSNSKLTDKLPCFSCHFFKNNPYLKCAVHPSTVLTQAALNCLDYTPQPDNNLLAKLKRFRDRDN